MARIVRSVGACPVCGNPVDRTVSVAAGLAHETFRCPTHGRLRYGQRQIPLASLAEASRRAARILVEPRISHGAASPSPELLAAIAAP